MHAGWHSSEDAGQRNWARALETYHSALTTYRRLMELKAQRRATLSAAPQVALAVGPADSSTVWGLDSGLTGLTAREREVARLIARGYTNQQIAETLVLTRGTVANHVAHILSKVGAANRTQVAAHVLEGQARPSAS